LGLAIVYLALQPLIGIFDVEQEVANFSVFRTILEQLLRNGDLFRLILLLAVFFLFLVLRLLILHCESCLHDCLHWPLNARLFLSQPLCYLIPHFFEHLETHSIVLTEILRQLLLLLGLVLRLCPYLLRTVHLEVALQVHLVPVARLVLGLLSESDQLQVSDDLLVKPLRQVLR